MNEETIIDIRWKRLGFSIKCNKCNNNQITIDNSLGYSALSGGWGSIDLICSKCNNVGKVYDSG